MIKPYKKLAMFGGTFSPIHNGHLAALKAYIGAVKPDVAYIIPTAVPPHKDRQDTVSDISRLEMIRIAVEDIDADCEIVVSDLEIKRGGKSYTFDTVNELLKIADEVVFFCGTDMLLTVDKWHRHDELLKIASVAYMQREDDLRYDAAVSEKARNLKTEYGTDIIALPPVSQEISSSMIRQKVFDGEDISLYVPRRVAEYIRLNGLYKPEG